MSDISTQKAVSTREALTRIETRPLPFLPVKVTGTTTGTAETIIAEANSQIQLVEALNLSSSAACNVTLHIVSDGDVADDTNIVVDALALSVNGYVSLDADFMLKPLDTLVIFSSVTDVVRVSGWSTVYL